MSPITTHVLDIATGRPAAGIAVSLEFSARANQSWVVIGRAKTDADGRVRDLLPGDRALEAGVYCLRFDASRESTFFPEIIVQFRVTDATQRYHIPLLLSPFGYSTYRGS
jgi:5-hydroxyisourate hydrolase